MISKGEFRVYAVLSWGELADNPVDQCLVGEWADNTVGQCLVG